MDEELKLINKFSERRLTIAECIIEAKKEYKEQLERLEYLHERLMDGYRREMGYTDSVLSTLIKLLGDYRNRTLESLKVKDETN